MKVLIEFEDVNSLRSNIGEVIKGIEYIVSGETSYVYVPAEIRVTCYREEDKIVSLTDAIRDLVDILRDLRRF